MLYVKASHSLLHEVTDNHIDLLALILELSGQKIRRADRFTQLALAGALACVRPGSLAEGSALILTSSVGTLSTSIAIMKKIGEESQPPKPFQFVNSLGNSACYFLAKMLNISGPSLATSQEESSFESALRHAEILLENNTVTQVLVGSVDEAPIPVGENLRRHGVSKTQFSACYEGSHWLSLGLQSEPTSLARISFLGSLRSAAGVAADLTTLGRGDLDCAARLTNISSPVDSPKEYCSAAAHVFPHGTYSGHNFVTACQMLQTSPAVIIVTRRRGSNRVDYSLVEVP